MQTNLLSKWTFQISFLQALPFVRQNSTSAQPSLCGCHLPKRPYLSFGMVFDFLVNFETVKRLGKENCKVWSSMDKTLASEMCSSVKFGQWLNILVFCRQVRVEARWPLESCADASSGHLSSRTGWFCIHPWKDFQHLCVGLVVDCTLSRQALISPDSKLFRWVKCLDLCQEYAFMIDFLISVCADPVWRSTWNKEYLELWCLLSLMRG